MNINMYAPPRMRPAENDYDDGPIELIDGRLQPRDGLWNSRGLMWIVAVVVAVGAVAYVFNYERNAMSDKIAVYQYQPASGAAGTAAPERNSVATGKDMVPTIAVPAAPTESTGGSTGGTYPSPANPHAIGAPPPNNPVPGAGKPQ